MVWGILCGVFHGESHVEAIAWVFSVLTLICRGIGAVEYSTLELTKPGRMDNMGLTEIPTGIPCHIGLLILAKNRLTRLEADDFICLSKLGLLDVSYNLITYIAPGGFDPLLSLKFLRLAGNRDLGELPSDFGPNTVNLKSLCIKDMNLQIIPPNSFWAQMPNISFLETDISFYNEFFNGWNNLETLHSIGKVAPNLTDRTPNIVHLYIWKAGVNLPSENVHNLKRLETVYIHQCTQLPTFEGAVSLKIISFKIFGPCQITSLPDYRHLVSLETLDLDMSQFYCDTASCWMLLETISNPTLAAVVAGTVCAGPEVLVGVNVTALSPVQIRCFEGKYQIFPWFSGSISKLLSNLRALNTKTKYTFVNVWSA